MTKRTHCLFPSGLAASLLIYLLVGSLFSSAARAQEESEEPVGEASYFKLHPDFIVNLLSDGGPHFLLTSIQVMSRDESGLAETKHHLPAIRHQLLLLLSEQSYGEVTDIEIRRALQNKALTAVNEVLAAESSTASVEGLFFTDFVVE